MPARPLAGRHILVTRPRERAGALVEGIERQGGRAVLFPALEIGEAEDGVLDAAIERLEEFDFAVFVSPNAAEKALRAITARRPWPARLRALAMGETSARELARFGVAGVLVPPAGRSDSEGLLERPELQEERVRGKRVAIFRGDGGRALLGDTLAARGARVEFIACYRRRKPAADPAPLLALWARGGPDAVTVTSSEGLRNLVEMAGGAGEAALKATPLLVAHRRIADEARRLGFREVELTAVGDAALLAALIARFGGQRT